MRRYLALLAIGAGCGSSPSTSPSTSTGGLDLSATASERFEEAAPPAARGPVQRALEAIDVQRVTASITRLASFPTRSTCSDPAPDGGAIGSARDWLRSELAGVPGLQTRLDPFAPGSCEGEVPRDNVVAWLPGRHPERLIVVGGHYDSRTVDVLDGSSPAPGANDSGSQTALVLEVARVLAGSAAAGEGFDATLVFVAFAGEEQGLLGSAAFVKGLGTSFAGAHVEAMLNCDIVGGDKSANDADALRTFRLYSPGTPREIKGADGSPDDTSPSRNLMRFVGWAATTYVPTMTMVPKLREDRMGRGGDHESFIAAGIAGVRFIDPGENLDHQHTADDRLEFVTPEYTARVAAVVAATAAGLATAPAAPSPPAVAGDAATITVTLPAAAPDGARYIVAVRPVSSNVHTRRLRAIGSEPLLLHAADLGLDGTTAFYLSLARVAPDGSESPFSAPEVRCDPAGCAVPADAANVTATR